MNEFKILKHSVTFGMQDFQEEQLDEIKKLKTRLNKNLVNFDSEIQTFDKEITVLTTLKENIKKLINSVNSKIEIVELDLGKF